MKNLLAMILLVSTCAASFAQDKPGDTLIAEYFAQQTKELSDACLAEIRTADDWQQRRGQYREQLLEMLGIPSLRQRTELGAQVTGQQQHGEIVVENVVFQSLPGLFVTANFYRPATAPEKPLPAILYACGHSPQKEDGISFGNKTAYHHHGVWFAEHGYACLVIDTIQLGEIEGTHHGTYREGRWWWNSRGYTPAGVEAWNGIRALDYLESRPEVDAERIGMTGRSGGGAYTWWVATLDERVKVAVPVAGITNLHNQVVDGVVEGHCDCMFHVNTYRWDFPAVAALIAPRPLLIANTDKDSIFPLDGVVDVYEKTRRIYELLGAGDKIGLAITEGPHQDTQALRTVAFEWFERHLKGQKPAEEFDARAPQVLDRETLRVLKEIPHNEIVTRIDESFVPIKNQRDEWMKHLHEKVFRAWPTGIHELELKELKREELEGVTLIHYQFLSQEPFRLPLIVAVPKGKITSAEIQVVGEEKWQELSADRFARLRAEASAGSKAIALAAPRGVGPTAWTDDERAQVHIRRRFMLLGQTLDGMRVWDIRRFIQAVAKTDALNELPLVLKAQGKMATNALYASLFESGIAEIELSRSPATHASGAPDYLNVLRALDVPSAMEMAKERCRVSVDEN